MRQASFVLVSGFMMFSFGLRSWFFHIFVCPQKESKREKVSMCLREGEKECAYG